jgi:hypothetical protein
MTPKPPTRTEFRLSWDGPWPHDCTYALMPVFTTTYPGCAGVEFRCVGRLRARIAGSGRRRRIDCPQPPHVLIVLTPRLDGQPAMTTMIASTIPEPVGRSAISPCSLPFEPSPG